MINIFSAEYDPFYTQSTVYHFKVQQSRLLSVKTMSYPTNPA